MMIPAFLLSEPIGIHAPFLHGWIESRQAISQRLGKENQLSIGDFYNQRRTLDVKEGIATIHVNDVLAGNLTNVEKLTGMTDYEDLIAELEQAASDPAVKGILLDINSPGGSAVGAPEAAAVVESIREQKPVVSVIPRIGASAAYYIASASNAIVAPQSAIVGSIGTIQTLFDYSQMLASFGIKVNIMTPEASDLKAAGNPYREMTPKEREFLQERIESLNANFTGFVSKHRSKAGPESMRGQWFSGEEGANAGLVDYVGGKARALAELKSLIQASGL